MHYTAALHCAALHCYALPCTVYTVHYTALHCNALPCTLRCTALLPKTFTWESASKTNQDAGERRDQSFMDIDLGRKYTNIIFNRPGLAGAVLQTPLSLIN